MIEISQPAPLFPGDNQYTVRVTENLPKGSKSRASAHFALGTDRAAAQAARAEACHAALHSTPSLAYEAAVITLENLANR